MLFLRALNLPAAAATFAGLYVAADKAPHVGEIGSLILWIVFPLVIALVLIKRLLRIAIVG